ncbi:MAG: formimidoylglutamate deiminase [Novosphingobium sp.]
MADEVNAGHTLHFGEALLTDGWASDVRITVANGLICGIAPGQAPQSLDERHAIGLPGMCNVHSHAFQRGMAGLSESRGLSDDSFWTWRDLMYRFVDRMDPEQLQAIAAFAYAEMLETGFTRVGEFHYLHHDAAGNPYSDPARLSQSIVAAAAGSGIGLTLLPVFYAHSGFGGTEPSHAQRRFINNLDGFARLLEAARTAIASLPGAIVGVAPHSLRAVTAGELHHLSEMAGDAPIHIHIAEQIREVDDCLAWSGARPVEWLLDHMPVDSRWCLVHATHMTEREALRLGESNAIVGLCPITEANLGDGLFPALPFFAAGGRFGIGSDSNVLIDLTEELRWLEYGQRLVQRSRNVLATGAGHSTGQDIFAAAVAGGANALGVAGGLAVGHSADLVSLDSQHPSLAGKSRCSIVDGFLFAGGRGAIDAVWRRGERLVTGGRHRARAQLAENYRQALAVLVA